MHQIRKLLSTWKLSMAIQTTQPVDNQENTAPECPGKMNNIMIKVAHRKLSF
jgi:hypothetical protein